MSNVINWFEIPVANMERAISFYQTVLGGEFYRMEMSGIDMAFFPMEGEGIGGALCCGEGYVPSEHGCLVFLNGGDDLSVALSRVNSAGGKVIQEKTLVREDIGFMAMFIDSEGNRIAFHSRY
ncbi:MAG: VOC family protein [Ignavibacteriales bacterium]|nr:VOC family protein [Ignavibacteriales bacterium]MCF8316558.1 VOC family protein [Ignavibacteriales bacterium]MCF8437481.1 VOC family protein [Ignavibacteriales bacterium]